MATLSSVPEPFVLNFSKQLAADMKVQYAQRLGDITVESLSEFIQTEITNNLPTKFSLARSRPDFESILLQLMLEVEKTQSWADVDISSTGQMILRAVAADADYAQFSIGRALQEAFLETARADTSIYASARTLGNRILRNVPCSVQVTFDRTDPGTLQTLPAWSAFTMQSNGAYFFNRTPLVFNEEDILMPVVLHQGIVSTAEIQSSGVKFQTVEVGNETWKMSDVDVRVFVDGVEWRRVLDPLWHYGPEDTVFWENTAANGNVEIRFGNGLTGASPVLGSTIKVMWVETEGATYNYLAAGQTIEVANAPSGWSTVVGTTTAPTTGGSDRKEASFYKLFGSNRRAAQLRSVRRADYRANAVEYPGVIDARFRGQAELNPTKPSWMNIVGVTLLTDPVFTERQWEDFTKWLNTSGIYQTRLLRMDPTMLPCTLSATIYCRPEANLSAVKTTLETQIRDTMALRAGSLGYSWYESDFDEMVTGKGELQSVIEYATGDFTDITAADSYQYVKLTSLSLTMAYTRRGGYEGRLDRDPNTPVSSNLFID